MAGLGIAAHHVLVARRALGADLVGRRLDLPRQGLRARQAEHVFEAVVLAPGHGLRPAIMTVASDQDAGLRPAGADAADEAAQVGSHLRAGRRLAGAQHDRDGAAALRVVDVDRQETALVVMRVEQRQLLVAMNHVARVVDVERHRLRLPRVGVHPGIDERIAEPDHVAQARERSRAATGSAANTGRPRCRAAAAGELEGGIGSKRVEIVGVLIAAADGEDASPDHVGEAVGDPRRIATVRD